MLEGAGRSLQSRDWYVRAQDSGGMTKTLDQVNGAEQSSPALPSR